MATTVDFHIDEETEAVEITNLVVRDSAVVSYFTDFDEQERGDALTRVLRVGVETLELADTAKDLEHVRREFDNLQQAFEGEIEDVREELDDRSGEDGDVEETLEEHFGVDGAGITHDAGDRTILGGYHPQDNHDYPEHADPDRAGGCQYPNRSDGFTYV